MDDLQATTSHTQRQWLLNYYFARAAFSVAWVLAALKLAPHAPGLQAALLVLYPAWDAVANLIDGRRSGGLAQNRTQAINVVVSVAVTLAVGAALGDMHRVLGVFGAWAILAGLLQLGTAWRRRKSSDAQWPMILSGAQSALAGTTFILQARMPAEPTLSTIAGYAGFGTFYFLVAAATLAVRRRTAGKV
ncbi:hypothetical protein IP92_03988 [Pseudoduganella flava]|uniref:DUF308 domain-containing protein n=1 Tax=Pseudoduganella flava TaxID=871742 RepID=A0A562PK81_9BURK|nr:DUF308 domain-containing protein [Pseudoduganella flava]QGZ42274.1 DUF308 domain-containing protein [Pseudoduganella flava]TWI44817.1 hypothetical protein IP92_03988 [Pseudoduganella flava]